MMLARIEPTDRPDYDCRTFECDRCGHARSEDVKFK
jgi:hypothetical protein